MKHRSVFAIVFIVIVGIAAAAFWPRQQPLTNIATSANSQASSSIVETAPEIETADGLKATTIEPASNTPTSNPPTDSTTPDPSRTFRVDSNGQLVLDEQTRLSIEALFARSEASELDRSKQASTQNLPPAAATQATALLERYDNYSKAQRQSYPPGAAPATEEAALSELEGLHALRVAHFGAEAAEALYGAEEAVTRRLIELMRLEKDQSLTMEEKAGRAQQLYDAMPAQYAGSQKADGVR